MGELIPFQSGPARLKFAKPERIEVKGDDWRALKAKVYHADGWHCRACSRQNNLTVHHMIHRSKQRMDVFEELLTLCSFCNDLEKDKLMEASWINRDLRIVSVRWRKTTAAEWEEAEPGRAPAWLHNGKHPLPQIVTPKRKPRLPPISHQHVSFREHLASKGQFFNRYEEWKANKGRIMGEVLSRQQLGHEDAALLIDVILGLEKSLL